MIRWEDIQNLSVTEDEINSLAGLTSSSSELNVLDGFTGDTSDLNGVIGLGALVSSHLSLDMVSAHTPLADSLDGLIITQGTVTEDRLAFSVTKPNDLLQIESDITGLSSDLEVQADRINNLYGIVFPGQTGDIADAIQQTIGHIDDSQDAHDATAISYGRIESGYYLLTQDILSGNTSTVFPLDILRFFRPLDEITLKDDISFEQTITIDSINYNTGAIVFSPAAATNYLVAENALVINENERNVQQAIERCLRNSTDTLMGRLTLDQGSGDEELHFTTGNIGSNSGYNFDLGAADTFQVTGPGALPLLELNDSGNLTITTAELRDTGSGFSGTIDKQPLTANRTWTLPDRDGFIAIGDITHTELLKVAIDNGTGEFSVAPGSALNYSEEVVHAWITENFGSNFAGSTEDLEVRLSTDGQLAGLGSDWIAVKVSIDPTDTLRFVYSPVETLEAVAITNVPLIPSLYMQLGLITVKGDGVGGIDLSSIKMARDLRPFLNKGLTNVFYDESVTYPAGLPALTTVQLPPNSRAGGISQGYTPGTAQLEVYVDQLFREVTRDYNELVGSPVGEIAFSYDLPEDVVVRFRMEYLPSGVVSGGGGTTNLQGAYINGPAITTSLVQGPVLLNDGTAGAQDALSVIGDIGLDGVVSSADGYSFTPQASEPGDLLAPVSKLYSDLNNDLLYKKYGAPSETINLTEDLRLAGLSQRDLFTNITGVSIPAFSIVALHPTTPKHIILADVSSNTAASRVIGITTEEIVHNASGKVVMSGRLENAGISFTHGDLIFADPTSSGNKISESSLSLTQGNVSVIIGTIDGDDLLVNLNRQGIFSN